MASHYYESTCQQNVCIPLSAHGEKGHGPKIVFLSTLAMKIFH
jgi:hypothetical protein